MKYNKILFVLITTGLILFSPLASAGVKTDALSGATVNIAFLSPETGDLSAYSPGFVNGAKLAFEEVKAAYPGTTWTFTVYDTKTTPEGATAAMTSAATDGATYVVGAAGSSNTLAAAAIAKTEKIPLISYASTSPELTTFADDGYLFRVAPSDGFQGGAMADLAEKGGFSKAVIINLDNAYGIGVADAFKSAFSGTVLKTIAYDPATFDASALVDQIAAQNPDIVIDVSYATDGSKLFVQMADQNLNVSIIGGDGIADDAIFDETAGTKEAMLNLVATKPTSVESDATKAFDKAYADAGYSGGIYTGEAYDAVWVGALAAVAADSVDGTAIRDEIYNLNYDGGSGKKVFDANGDITTAAYLIMEVQSTGFVEVGNWIDGTLTLDTGFTQKRSVVGDVGVDDGALPFPIFSLFVGIAVIGLIRKRKN